MKENEPSKFEEAADAQSSSSFIGELWGFIKTNKKWWLLPIIVVFLILGLLLLLSTTGLSPLLYPFF